MNRVLKVLVPIFVVAAMIALVQPVLADTITWSTPAQVTGASVIDVNGTLVSAGHWDGGSVSGTAYNFTAAGASGDLTVTVGSQNVTFLGATHYGTRPGTNIYIGGGPLYGSSIFSAPTGCDANFAEALQGYEYNFQGASPPITVNGLTAGHKYELQLFALDDGQPGYTHVFSDAASGGHSVSWTNGSGMGYAIGTWTAAGTTTGIYVAGTNFNILNAYVLRDVTPEPSALVLLGTGLVSLLCYAWKKRK